MSAIALLLVGAVFVVSRSRPMNTPSDRPVSTTEAREIRLLFAGDIMLSRKIGKVMEDKNDYRFYFRKVASTTLDADIAFANLENPVSTGGVRSGSIYSFRADPKTLEGLRYAGFDVVSVANNHIFDYGKQAFYDTLAHLHDAGITAVGGGGDYEDAHAPRVITVGKTRVAFLAYTDLVPASLGLASSTPAVSTLGLSQILSYEKKRDIASTTVPALIRDIKVARESADTVVVSIHWGDEYQTKHNRVQERIAKLAIDAGADIIVGHHPHVVQEVEEYNGGLIIYSLGNFVFDQNFSDDTRLGLVVEVTMHDGVRAHSVQKEVAFTDDYQAYFVE